MRTLQQEEALVDIRTVLNYKGAILDLGNQEQLNSFNELIAQYNELKNPAIIQEREDHVASKKKEMEELKNLDMSKIKFSNKKMKTNKIKIL